MAAPGATKGEDPLAPTKASLDAQMRRPPYDPFASEYEATEFQDSRNTETTSWGQNQTFTGLTHGTHLGKHTPHGYGIMEHHEGFTQACGIWRDGVADGRGKWMLHSATAGQEQCGYGTWVEGKRDGYFALVKEGGVYIEEYAAGELKRRIKWRKDKLHVKCERCYGLFVPSADTGEKFCRYHWNAPDFNGRYPCCGALQSVNPRGCCLGRHQLEEVPAAEAPRADASAVGYAGATAVPAAVSSSGGQAPGTGLIEDMLSDFAALGVGSSDASAPP